MIRKPIAKDAHSIASICQTSLGHDTSESLLSVKIASLCDKPEYFIMVYEDDETKEVKGFIQAQKYELLYGADGWNIIALAVSTQTQNQGIGKSLLNSLEQHAMALGDSFVRLNSRMDRLQAHGFYEHMGYCCDKDQKRFIKQLKKEYS